MSNHYHFSNQVHEALKGDVRRNDVRVRLMLSLSVRVHDSEVAWTWEAEHRASKAAVPPPFASLSRLYCP
jgi:hypothetical protein